MDYDAQAQTETAMAQEKAATPIDLVCQAIALKLEMLDKATEELRIRLAPVLVDDEPEGPSPVTDSDYATGGSELMSRLAGVDDQLDTLLARTRKVTRRLVV